MHFVGIDLAWGDRQPTGLAVLDEDARLLHVSAVRTDEEIRTALTPYVEGPCLVGIDAPLIVVNPTGSRPAEQELTRDFRRFEAGAHPSNTGKPEFANGTRGARVCKMFGLDMDPRSGRKRRAIEVYPHPATVVLFGLGKTPEVQGQARSQPRPAALRAAPADGPRRAPRHHRPDLARAAHPGRDRHPQGRPAPGRGPGRRGRLCLRRALRRPLARADHDVRRLRARLHRHPDAAGRARHDPHGRRGVRPASTRPWSRTRRSTSRW